MATFSANTSDLDKLASALLSDAPAAIKTNLRKSVLQAGRLVANDAKGRTSQRVAATIRVTTNATTAKITAGNSDTPEASLLEGDGTPGSWRHPLFGNRNHWYEQARKPYLHPARDAQQQNVSDLIVAGCVEAVNNTVGLYGGGGTAA